MDNQHRKISGYRELSQEEIDLMNEVKHEAERVGHLLDRLRAKNLDMRWLSIGQTHLQQGFMAVTRAIAQPNSF